MVRKSVSGKKVLTMLVVALLSIFAFGQAMVFAKESEIPDPTIPFYINDFADIISDSVEREMLDKAVKFSHESNGVQVVVTTVRTIGNEDPVYYTTDMYNKYKIGKKNMGVLIMLSVETRDIQIRVGDNMTKYLSDRKCGDIIDDYGIEYFKDGKFEKGLYEMQKATIEYLESKMLKADSEVAVTPTEIEEIVCKDTVEKYTEKQNAQEQENNVNKEHVSTGTEKKSFLKTFLASLTSFVGVFAVMFGFDEKKKKEEEQQKVQKLESQKTDLKVELNSANEKITIKQAEVYSLYQELQVTKQEVRRLEERMKRAIIAYPDLDEKINGIFAKEKEEADKKVALEVENYMRQVVNLKSAIENLSTFKNACDKYDNLSSAQQRFVPADLVTKVTQLYNESLQLQKQFEKEEKIRKDKQKAKDVQDHILRNLDMKVSRHAFSDLSRTCRAYDSLSHEQKSYINADVGALYEMKNRAQRLQDEHREKERRRLREEDERRERIERERRRLREEERRERIERERRRLREEDERQEREEKEEQRRMFSSSGGSSFSGGNHGGFGGHSSGHGAGRKF